MAFDPKCYDLAEAFLVDEPAIASEENKKKLAQAIQTVIEEEIEYLKSPCPSCGEPIGLDHKNCVWF